MTSPHPAPDPPGDPDPWTTDPWPPADPEPDVVARLRGGDELIAALPVLLGFHPAESLVLVAFGGRSTTRVGLTVRVDLPPPEHVGPVCSEAVAALLSDEPYGAAVVVLGGSGSAPGSGPPASPDRLPRPDVAATAARMLVEAGVEPYGVLWASGTGTGQFWACYDVPGQRCGCVGEVPDPQSTVLAAAAARRGRAVLADRAAVADVLVTDDEDALRRRARLRASEIDAALARAARGDAPDPDRTAEHRAVLRRAVADAAACRLAVDDATVLRFCSAFDSPDVRTDAVRYCLGPDAPAAEQLWAALSRTMPEPERADPTALLAVCALLRGDGPLAGIAARRAGAVFPGHRLAGLVVTALDTLAGPPGLRRVLEQTYGRP